MIVYGCAVTDGDEFARCAEPGIRRVLEADANSELLAFASTGSIFRNYNLICERVAEREDLEALVLVHQDAEIADAQFSAKVRAELADPDVAIVGCAGAIGVRSMAWWEGAVTWASFTHRYEEMGGGEIPAISWHSGEPPPYASTGEVDVIDGFVMALSPWAVRNLRFDEALGGNHGYDVDLCLQARAAGRKVVTADLRVVHHHSLELLDEPEAWIRAHAALAEKWDEQLSAGAASNGDWRERARRAEAEAAAYRLMMGGAELQRDAARQQLDLTRRTTSWRVTAPLRSLSERLKRRR